MDRRCPHALPCAPRTLRVVALLLPVLACSGCDMLGALFDTRVLRGIVLVIAVLAVVGFVASRAGRR